MFKSKKVRALEAENAHLRRMIKDLQTENFDCRSDIDKINTICKRCFPAGDYATALRNQQMAGMQNATSSPIG